MRRLQFEERGGGGADHTTPRLLLSVLLRVRLYGCIIACSDDCMFTSVHDRFMVLV